MDSNVLVNIKTLVPLNTEAIHLLADTDTLLSTNAFIFYFVERDSSHEPMQA